MQYDFDTPVDRRGTYCFKYDGLRALYPNANDETIPMQVADMDFCTAQPILDALHRTVDFGMFGYTGDWCAPAYAQAVCNWWQRQYACTFPPEAVTFADGTIEALGAVVRAFSCVGDGVILSRPVYGHFTQAIEDQWHRKVVDSHLIENDDGSYVMDFSDIEKKCADPMNRIFLLCSPANPAGRVWTPEELKALVAICQKHHVLLISDEVHCDIRRKGVIHTPILNVTEDHSNIILLTAINKTFNLAGLQCSNAIIPDPALRARFRSALSAEPTPFAVAACIAAYNEGQAWMEQMNAYIDGNIDFALAFLKEQLPWVRVQRPEGTYCLWLDFRKSGLPDKEIHRRIYDEANVILQDGVVHDPGLGRGFQRMCVPCPRSILETALSRIAAQFR